MARFAQVLRYEMALSWRRYATVIYGCLGSIAVLILLLMFTGDWYKHEYGHNDSMMMVEAGIFTVALVFFSSLAAAALGGNLKDKAGRISAFMLPATQLEKYMARWVIFIPLALVVFLIGFIGIDLLRVALASVFFPHASGHIHSVFTLFSSQHILDGVAWIASYIMSLQASFALGSMLWPKNSWVKTFAALSILGMLVSFIMVWLALALFRDMAGYTLAGMDFLDDHGAWCMLAVTMLWAVVYHVIAYYRYKEMEIIQRW